MDRLGRLFLWLGLIAVALVGIWLFVTAKNATPLPDVADLTNPLSLVKPAITPTVYPAAATVLQSVQSLSRLETASYYMQQVITAESGQGPFAFLMGDKLMLVAYGEVIAGIDLSNFGPDDLSTSDDGIAYVRVPPVEVFLTHLDNEKTYVYDRRTGVVGMNAQLESAARQSAETMILQAAIEAGIEAEAEENARDVLRAFILGLGLRDVVFVDVLPTPSPAASSSTSTTP